MAFQIDSVLSKLPLEISSAPRSRPETLAIHDTVPQVGGSWPIDAAVAGPIGAGDKEVFHRSIFVESALCRRRAG